MPTIEKMKDDLKVHYQGEAWSNKVNTMPDNQIIAIWHSIQERLKKNQKKNGVVQLPLFENSKPEFVIDSDSFECGSGWHTIITEALYRIKNIAIRDNLNIRVLQVKEKFGEIDIFLNRYTPEIDQIITETRKKARKTCEICGKSGIFGSNMDGWYMTRCIDCLPKGTFMLEEEE
jgi:hypothetical protein